VNIKGNVAIVTGAASGIGRAVAQELGRRGAKTVALVDLAESVKDTAHELGATADGAKFKPFVGNTSDDAFRAGVFDELIETVGLPRILVPAAGITRDGLTVKVDKETGEARIYDIDKFRLVLEVNLTAPIYWSVEMVARIAQDRFANNLKRWAPDQGIQGTVVFIGSVSSQGNRGQIGYAATKAGLVGASATLMQEAMFYGVRTAVVHPGFTATPMVKAMPEEIVSEHVLPHTQLKRLIEPEEIADAVCFLVTNEAVTGSLWADAGWRPTP